MPVEQIAGQYLVSPPTFGDGQTVLVQVDAQGNLKTVASGSAPVGGGITYTDKTITNFSGASQTLMAANAARKSFFVKNGATACAINILGGTAAVGGAGCMTLEPYELVRFEGAACPLGAITIIGTAANYANAFEGT